ncbi:hypothetical protein [Halarsenatibacter silvermanii]|uniref:Uncharacterized protein n=1 Tax=Halarsenatibacter silvermanii TaxID=321763 RepID=A0A1G9HRL1_9FIRM|nr:hypothetical protein [Halarsenatibacter silvermanii]SDL15492.1 hypothetical protein SAMN04488692_10214 [Halarsenatibacter silvermanii]
MKWIRTIGDLEELEEKEDLPGEMLSQMRGLLESMHETHGGEENLEDFDLWWGTGGPMALLTGEDFDSGGCLVTGELGLDPGRRLSENSAEFVEEHESYGGKKFFRLAYVVDNDNCLTVFLTGDAPDEKTESWLEERALLDAKSLGEEAPGDVPF